LYPKALSERRSSADGGLNIRRMTALRRLPPKMQRSKAPHSGQIFQIVSKLLIKTFASDFRDGFALDTVKALRKTVQT